MSPDVYRTKQKRRKMEHLSKSARDPNLILAPRRRNNGLDLYLGSSGSLKNKPSIDNASCDSGEIA